MAVRILFLLLALSWPAAAAQDWMQDVLGAYEGPVLNDGQIERGATTFGIDAAGQLTGHYRIDDPSPFEGELTDFREDAPYSGSFTWHDRYGEGIVHIVFDPDHGRFLGLWGASQPLEGHIFNGYRDAPHVGS
ncbi:MAG TPA: hypothetical protein VGH36_02725 [Acetobacteraceae bacterium]|jgi:hypothetical protein